MGYVIHNDQHDGKENTQNRGSTVLIENRDGDRRSSP